MVARIRSAPKSPQLMELSSHIITPAIRYSKPELQTHATYLYSLTNWHRPKRSAATAIERYEILRANWTFAWRS